MIEIPTELISLDTIIVTCIVLVVALIVKGFAMYRAARKESKVWFWVLLIFNTLGILPLLYLIFSKKSSGGE